MSSQSEKESSSPTIEPKKSARLAQKRKLREEAGTPVSEDDFYFPQFNYGKGISGFSPIKSGSGLQQSFSTLPMSKDKIISSDTSASSKHTIKNITPPSPLVKPTPKSSSRPIPSTSKSSIEIIALPTSAQTSNNLSSSLPLKISSSSNFTSYPKNIVIKSSPNIYPNNMTNIKNDNNVSDEEKWLGTFDSEKLNEFDVELQMIKNSKVMIGKQKTLFEMNDKDLLSNPVKLEGLNLDGNIKQEKLPLRTVEMIQQRIEKTEGLRILDLEKCEKEKEKLEQLLGMLNSSKQIPDKPKIFGESNIVFVTRVGGNTITFPPGMDIPIKKTTSLPPPPTIIKCFVEGCLNQKKYSCSKTKVPLCSLNCYKINLEKYNYKEQQSSMKTDEIELKES